MLDQFFSALGIVTPFGAETRVAWLRERSEYSPTRRVAGERPGHSSRD